MNDDLTERVIQLAEMVLQLTNKVSGLENRVKELEVQSNEPRYNKPIGTARERPA